LIEIYIKKNLKKFIIVKNLIGIDNDFLSNKINKWKLKTNKFKKISVLENPKDYQNKLILREYRS